MSSPRNVLIVGATGGTGKQLVTLALECGHTVTALVREAAKAPPPHERLRVVVGTIGDGTTLMRAIEGQDVVISALGRGMSFTSDGLMQRAVPLFPRLFAALKLRDIYADKAIGEDLIRKSDLDWTIVHPPQLTDGKRTGRYRSGERMKFRAFPAISRADLADFMLTQIHDRTNYRKTVCVDY